MSNSKLWPIYKLLIEARQERIKKMKENELLDNLKEWLPLVEWEVQSDPLSSYIAVGTIAINDKHLAVGIMLDKTRLERYSIGQIEHYVVGAFMTHLQAYLQEKKRKRTITLY